MNLNFFKTDGCHLLYILCSGHVGCRNTHTILFFGYKRFAGAEYSISASEMYSLRHLITKNKTFETMVILVFLSVDFFVVHVMLF